jgi:hypothetical protein
MATVSSPPGRPTCKSPHSVLLTSCSLTTPFPSCARWLALPFFFFFVFSRSSPQPELASANRRRPSRTLNLTGAALVSSIAPPPYLSSPPRFLLLYSRYTKQWVISFGTNMLTLSRLRLLFVSLGTFDVFVTQSKLGAPLRRRRLGRLLGYILPQVLLGLR